MQGQVCVTPCVPAPGPVYWWKLDKHMLGEGRKKAGSGSHSQSSGMQVTKVNLPS